MINYENEVVRLLLEICILLLKANRYEIEVKELNKICEKHFGIIKVSKLLSKKDFARYKCSSDDEWDNEAKEWKKIHLVYSLKEYQEVIQKINNKELAYIPEELLRGDFRDYPIRNKIIWGIGEKAITLIDKVEYHEECVRPRIAIGKKQFINYKKDKLEAEKLAQEIIKEYGNGK